MATKKDKFAEKLEQLKSGLEGLETEELAVETMKLQALMVRFGHKYSLANTYRAMIEAKMRGESITFLGSRAFWYKVGGEYNRITEAEEWRYYGVIKGMKGYSCVFPRFKKVENKETGEREDKMFGYGTGEVFDISQTGFTPEMIEALFPRPQFLDNDSMADSLDKVVKVVESLGYTVKFEELRKGLSGFITQTNKEITINTLDSIDDQVSTLFHELAHGELKHGCGGEHDIIGYEGAEVQAESVAYILASALGLDTSKYSLRYIKSYGKELDFILECASKTNKVVNKVMNELIEIFGESEEEAVA